MKSTYEEVNIALRESANRLHSTGVDVLAMPPEELLCLRDAIFLEHNWTTEEYETAYKWHEPQHKYSLDIMSDEEREFIESIVSAEDFEILQTIEYKDPDSLDRISNILDKYFPSRNKN